MSKFFHSSWRVYAGLLLSAAMFGLYSRGGNAYLLGFIALVPWLMVLNASKTVVSNALSGLLMSFVFVAAVFTWFGFAVGTFTGIGAAPGLFVVLAAAPLLQPQFLAFALTRHLVGRRHGAIVRALAAALAWVATEWLVPRLFGDTLGHGLFPSYVLRQIADIGGAAGITFLLIIINECIAEAITRRRDGSRALIKPLVLAASFLALMIGYGVVRLSTLTPSSETAAPSTLRIGMIQSNIVNIEQMRREIGAFAAVRHILDTHYALSHDAIDQHDADALLWSETVYPTTFGHPKNEAGGELDREVLEFVTASRVPLVFGTYDIDENGEYNATAFVEPTSGLLGFYRKTNPFPLTEYVPAWLDGPTFRRVLPWAGTWKPGTGARVFPLRLTDGREIPVMSMICLDDVDSGLAIEGTRLGAQVILGMSNDSWFTGHPVGANLHLTVAAFRSIETRLPQMRVTTNGISAVIDATGTVIASTSMDEQKIQVGEVTPRAPPATLMVLWGDWFGRTAFVLLFLFAAVSVITARMGRHSVRAKHDGSAPATEAPPTMHSFNVKCVLLTPFLRITAAVLQLFAFGGLLWLGAAMLFPDDTQTNTLERIWMLIGLILTPLAAKWLIMRASITTIRIENNALILNQKHQRIEIRVMDIRAVESWALPFPNSGIWLRLGSGQRWSHGIASVDPASIAQALVHAGGHPSLLDLRHTRVAAYLRARLTTTRGWIDHPVVKFAAFPLLPALVAFRMHQHIAYGGTFGEYYTFGMKAYLSALIIWWATWAIGLVALAAALRILIEIGNLLMCVWRPVLALNARTWSERLGHLIYYVGVPIWLLLRIVSG